MFYIAILLIILIFAFSMAIAGFSIAPWLPVRRRDLDRINELASLKPGQTFYELGSGDGRVCKYIAEKNPQVRVVGVELSLLMYLWSRIGMWFSKPKNLKIEFGNVLKKDLSKADVVYTFAITKSINGKLKNKFEKELKKNAKVLSYIFSIKNWKGRVAKNRPGEKDQVIYIYKF